MQLSMSITNRSYKFCAVEHLLLRSCLQKQLSINLFPVLPKVCEITLDQEIHFVVLLLGMEVDLNFMVQL